MVFKGGFHCRVETEFYNVIRAGTGEPSTQANDSVPAAITVFDREFMLLHREGQEHLRKGHVKVSLRLSNRTLGLMA